MSRIDETMEFIPVRIAVLTVSDTRDRSQDKSGDVLQARIEDAGHRLVERHILPDERDQIADQLRLWCADDGIDVVITTGERTVAHYLTSPLMDAVRKSMIEE